VTVAASILRYCCPGLHPASALLACAAQLRAEPQPAQPPIAFHPLPLPLLLMARGVAALGPPVRLPTAGNPAPGAWCAAAPLWGNPWLDLESRLWGLAHTARPLVHATHLHDLGVALRRPDGSLVFSAASTQYWRSLWQCDGLWAVSQPAVGDLLQDPADLSRFQLDLWQRLPASWRAAVDPGVAISSDLCSEAVCQCVAGWGWLPVGPGGQPDESRAVSVLGDKHTVRSLTRIILGPVVQERAARTRAFVGSAVQGLEPAPDVRALHSAFVVGLSAVWRLPLPNLHKEVLWRLSINGVSGAGGHDLVPSRPCPGGWRPSPEERAWPTATGAPAARAHVFYSCPVAQAVFDAVKACLPPPLRLQRHQLWLCIPPCVDINLSVWRVVCLAALSAMWKGHRLLWTLEQPDVLLGASRRAVADFWSRLDDCVSALNASGAQWFGAEALPADHPFVASVPGFPGRCCVTFPVDPG
jgi:hypothetical protein